MAGGQGVGKQPLGTQGQIAHRRPAQGAGVLGGPSLWACAVNVGCELCVLPCREGGVEPHALGNVADSSA